MTVFPTSTSGTHPKTTFNYATWGLAGHSVLNANIARETRPFTNEQIELAKKSIPCALDGYELYTAYCVSHYQGPDKDSRQVAFLRFKPISDNAHTLFKEHISMLRQKLQPKTSLKDI